MEELIRTLKTFSFSNVHLSRLFDWNYLTTKHPQSDFYFREVAYSAGIVCIFLSLLIYIYIPRLLRKYPPKYKFIRKINLFLISNSVALLLYTIIRQEGVSILSMRIFGVIIFLSYVLIAIYFLVYWIFLMPKRLEKFKEARLRDKYLHRKRH